MKKFLKKFLLFIALFFVFIIGIIVVNRNFSNFKIKKEAKIIMIGHSHSACAYNDSIIENSLNISQNGESYFYNYFRLRKVIDQNSSINTLWIEFSNNQITKRMDAWIWEEEKMASRYPRYATLMGNSDLKILFKNNPKCFKENVISSLKTAIKATFDRGYYYEHAGLAGYQISKDDNKGTLSDFDDEEYEDKTEIQYSETNLLYLRKMIDYAKNKGINVFLVRSPKHKLYKGFQTDEIYQKVYAERFSDIELLDFSRFPLEDEQFFDYEHLNYKGALEFSSWLERLMINGLLSVENKQKFINESLSNKIGSTTNLMENLKLA